MDDHFGLAATQPGHLDRVLEPNCGADPGKGLAWRAEPKPDALALKAPDQRYAATLKQLSLGPREPASCCKSPGKCGKRWVRR
jgi:hypothetical protein